MIIQSIYKIKAMRKIKSGYEIYICLLFCCTFFYNGFSQSNVVSITDIAKPEITKGWIDFHEDNSLDPATLFNERGYWFGLSVYDNMQLYKTVTDEIGFTHFRFQQYHKGIKVIGAEAILHHNGSYLKSMNGHLAENLSMNVHPKYDKSLALLNALAACKGVDVFVWDDADVRSELSKYIKEEKFLEKPEGELVICRKDWSGDFNSENLVLAYYFRLLAMPMIASRDIYMDAGTGEIIHQASLSTNCNPNTGNTTWYGSKTFNAGFYGFPNNTWFLESHCPGEATMRSLRGDPIVLYNYGDANGSWTDANGVNGYNQRAGVTTYYAIHRAYDYYKINHARLSYDGGNGQLDCFSEITGGTWLSSANNATWNSVTHTMHFGAGNTAAPTDDWNTYDIVGHEMTHGVHQWSIGFNYSGEPGALDESFADIFGECIEAFAKGLAVPDWQIGGDRGAIRSMNNPNAFADPHTYLGGFWIVIPGCSFDPINGSPTDFCGVHTNSGVQNYWFYLLTSGGSGTNDNSQSYTVTGIGLTAARNIAYRNMDVYLTSSSGYIDAREGSIRAASDLFGWCSNEVLQTARAWYAVGVASTSPDWNYVVPCGNVVAGSIHRGINTLSTNIACTTTLPSGSNAVFSATSGGGVVLNPGFTAVQGCAFTATIDYCNEAAYNLRSAPLVQEQENANEALAIIDVYPQPAIDKVTLVYKMKDDDESVLVEIVDAAGKTVRHLNVQNTFNNEKGNVTIDVSDLKEGIYFVSLRNVDSKASCKLIITE